MLALLAPQSTGHATLTGPDGTQLELPGEMPFERLPSSDDQRRGYVPTSLVLQRIDGVEPAFLRQLNQYADVPDLTIILTGDPAKSRARAHQRGTYSRFHRDDGGAEATLYRTVVNELAAAGWPVLHHEVADEPAEAVVAVLLNAILSRRAERSG